VGLTAVTFLVSFPLVQVIVDKTGFFTVVVVTTVCAEGIPAIEEFRLEPVPAAFTAATVNTYRFPFVRPFIMQINADVVHLTVFESSVIM